MNKFTEDAQWFATQAKLHRLALPTSELSSDVRLQAVTWGQCPDPSRGVDDALLLATETQTQT